MNNIELRELAERLHFLFCTENHIDSCGWQYEERQKNNKWEGWAHKHWFEKAKLVSEYMKHEMGSI